MCEEIKTECSSSLVNSLKISRISFLTTGSSPLVASSRIKSFASCASAVAI